MVGLARSVAHDYGRHGIRCNALCPGWVRTAMGDRAMDEIAERTGITRDEAYAWSQALIPLGGRPNRMRSRRAALFLASDDSSYVTGSALIVDGGTMTVDAASSGVPPGRSTVNTLGMPTR